MSTTCNEQWSAITFVLNATVFNAACMEFNCLSNSFKAIGSVEERSHFEPLGSSQLLSLDTTVGTRGVTLWSKLHHHRRRIGVLLSGGPLELASPRTLFLKFLIGQDSRPNCSAGVWRIPYIPNRATDANSTKCSSRVRSVPAICV